MSSIEDALRKIAEQTGSHCVSVSLFTELSAPFNVYLHSDVCRHGAGKSLDEAVEAAKADRLYARASYGEKAEAAQVQP